MVLGVSKRMEHMPVRLSLDFHNLNESQTKVLSRLKYFTIGAEFYLSRSLICVSDLIIKGEKILQ